MIPESKKNIFMVEDDQNFGAVLKSYLEIHEYVVTWINDGALAIEEFKRSDFDICILDVMLPNVDGFSIASQIRELDSNIPFVFLTAKTLKDDILKGFRLGADDYITKPFDSEVLLCKINAILNRNRSAEGNEDKLIFKLGKYHFNFELRSIRTEDIQHKLTPKEAELLKLLCQHKNKTLPRETALIRIWGDNSYFTTRSMDVFITKLRKYLKDDPRIEIVNVHSSEYRLQVSD